MGLWYNLEVATKLNAASAIRLFTDRLDLKPSEESPLGVGREGLYISANDVTRDWSLELYEAAFHFTPTLSVGFKISGAYGDQAENTRVMLRATMLLLESGDDAVLLFNGEQTVLQRLLGGELVLNERALKWDKYEDEIYIPHERRHIPSYMLNP